MRDGRDPPDWLLEEEARALESAEPEPIPDDVARKMQRRFVALLRDVAVEQPAPVFAETIGARLLRWLGVTPVRLRPLAISASAAVLVVAIVGTAVARVSSWGEPAFWKPFIEGHALIVLGAAPVQVKDRPGVWVDNFIGLADARAAGELYAGLGRTADQDALRQLPLTNALIAEKTADSSLICIGGMQANPITLETLEALTAAGMPTRFEFVLSPEAADDPEFPHPPYSRVTSVTDIDPRTAKQFVGIVEKGPDNTPRQVYPVCLLDAEHGWQSTHKDYGVIIYAEIPRKQGTRHVLLLMGYEQAGGIACLRAALSRDFVRKAKGRSFYEMVVEAGGDEVVKYNVLDAGEKGL